MEILATGQAPKQKAPDRTGRGARRCLCIGEEMSVTPYETRMLELLEQLESTLDEVRELLDRREPAKTSAAAREIEAFADEAFRDRDA